MDAGKPGLQALFKGAFKHSKTADPKALAIIYSEESVLQRRYDRSSVGRSGTKGLMTLNQVEHLVSISSDVLKAARRSNKFFAGTTAGNALLDVSMGTYDNAWKLPQTLRNQMLADSRINVSTKKSEKDTAGKEMAEVQEPEAHEVVNYDCMCQRLCLEILHRFEFNGVLHLTAKDDIFAAAAVIENGVPYVGVTFSALHCNLLQRRLQSLVFKNFLSPGSSKFKPDLASLFQIEATPAVNQVAALSLDQTYCLSSYVYVSLHCT